MRYCRYQSPEGPRYATVDDRPDASGAVSLHAVATMAPPPEDLAATALHAQHHLHAFTSVSLEDLEREGRLLFPCVPSKIVCVGRNYRDHAAELGNEVPKEPLLFLKPPSSLLGAGQTVRMPSLSRRIDFEGELAVILGKRLSQPASDDEALEAVRGFTCLNDVTARDIQKSDPQWTRGKGFDTFCPVGPLVLVPDAAEAFDAASATLTTLVNGEAKQHGNTRDFIFPLAHLLRYISACMTLEPGDVIATGTPAGVAALTPGDVVEVRIDGLGTLRNPFAAA